MKPQDILFIISCIFLLWKQNPRWLIFAGLLSLCIAIPLFAKYIFFTAEHLVWYAAGFFTLAILLLILQNKNHV